MTRGIQSKSTDDSSRSDATLVLAARAGDKAAFGCLVERYQPLVCGIAYATVGDVAASDDIAQDIFLTAWRKLRMLREPDKVRAWLSKMARGIALDAQRRRYREQLRDAQEGERIEDSQPTVEEQRIAAQERRLLWECMSNLAPKYREPVVLFYREEQSIAQVAAQLGLTPATAKQRLSRGRSQLRDRMLKALESDLRQTRRGRDFAAAVVAALPVLAPAPAEASVGTMGASSASKRWLGVLAAVAVPVGVVCVVLSTGIGGHDHAAEEDPNDAALVAQDHTGKDDTVANTKPSEPAVLSPAPAVLATPDPGTIESETSTQKGLLRAIVNLEPINRPCAFAHIKVLALGECPDGRIECEVGKTGLTNLDGQIVFSDLEVGTYTVIAVCYDEPSELGRTRFSRSEASVVISKDDATAGEPRDLQITLEVPEDWRGVSSGEIPARYAHLGISPGEISDFTAPRDAPDSDPGPDADADGDGKLSDLEWKLHNAIIGYELENGDGSAEGKGALMLETQMARGLGVSLDSAAQLGDEHAPIELIEVVGPACPWCARAHLTLLQLLQEYGTRLQVRTLVLDHEDHPHEAALATCAARHMGAFYPYLQAQWANATAEYRDYSRDNLRRIATNVGLNASRFDSLLESDLCEREVAGQTLELQAAGVRGTPTWVINGFRVTGAKSVEHYREIIDRKLAELE